MPRRTRLPLVALIVVLAIGIAWLMRNLAPRSDRGTSQPDSQSRADLTPAQPKPVELAAPQSESRQADANPSPAGSDQVALASVDTGFLPYPNAGEAAFRRKYGDLDKVALGETLLRLRKRLDEEVDHVVEDRYARGLFDEKVYPSEKEANSDSKRSDPPRGLGEVWPCERGNLQPDGSIQRWTTALTEAEYPELFANRAEYLWVAHENWRLTHGFPRQ